LWRKQDRNGFTVGQSHARACADPFTVSRSGGVAFANSNSFTFAKSFAFAQPFADAGSRYLRHSPFRTRGVGD
jgi:hypothetical protein